MEGRQYIFNLNGTNGDDIALEATNLPDSSTVNCPLERSKYKKVEQVYRHHGEIAVLAKVYCMMMKAVKQHCLLAPLILCVLGIVVHIYFLKTPSLHEMYETTQFLTSRNRSGNLILLQHPCKINLIHKEISENGTDTILHLKNCSRNILLYTALLTNNSYVSSWDRLAITGWEHRELFHLKSVCCVRYQSGLVVRYRVITKARRHRVEMQARQYICKLNSRNADDVALESTIVLDDSTVDCPLDRSKYLKIEYIYRHPGEIALFAKIIYDNPSATDLLAWFEIHRLMGLGKAVFYTFRLSESATTVLNYYREKGIAELIPYEFPDSKYYGDGLQAAVHGIEQFNNEIVTLMDGQERLRGYKYLLCIDIDEYVVPHHNETWIKLFDRLCASHPNAAGFLFGAYWYATNWGAASNTSLFAVGKFLNRARFTQGRLKHFSVPNRLATGGISAHQIIAKEGFKRYMVPEEVASVRHYRSCWSSKRIIKENCSEIKQFTDEFLYKLFKPIEKDVLDLKARLGV